MSEQQVNATPVTAFATTFINNTESVESVEVAQFDWVAHWQAQGQSWRTEPEIDADRQQFLAQRRAVTVDIITGRYPFKDVPLNRADVEWLLATHEDGRGPVDWNDLSQRNRWGLDLRGGDLRNQNLQGLPLTKLQAGIYWTEGSRSLTRAQIHEASIHLEGADLRSCQLQGAKLYHAYLQNAVLGEAEVQEAQLNEANFQSTILMRCNFERANLEDVHFEGAFLLQAKLGGTNLVGTFFSAACELDGVNLCDENNHYPILVDTNWGDAVLAVLDFESLPITGDEQKAHQTHTTDGEPKDRATRLREYRRAVRANRQLSLALDAQGLSEEAARFAYRAQKLQRRVLAWQGRYGQYFFSVFLDLLAGYGYKPSRSFLAYLLVNFTFATAYYLLGPSQGLSLTPLEALVFSLTSFHGRGFSAGTNIGLSSPITLLAALEAFVGLLVELTLIATFTQRLFHK